MPYGTVSIQDLPVVSPHMKTLPTITRGRPHSSLKASLRGSVMWYLVPRNILSPQTKYFRKAEICALERLNISDIAWNIWSPSPISNHWRWYRQVLKVNGTSSSSHGLHHWLPVDSFDVYRNLEMVEGKKWGECTKCLRWYHTDKCLNISQKSLEGDDWVCPDCLSWEHFIHFCIMYFIFIHALVTCMSFMHFWHLHCLAPSLFHSLTTISMHCLIRISPYCYLIHGTKYFRGDWIFHIQCWNIQSRGTKLGGTKIFMTGVQCLLGNMLSCLHARTQCCCCIHFCT